MNGQDQIKTLEAKLIALRQKEKRTGGSRSLTLEIDSVKWQIKCLKKG